MIDFRTESLNNENNYPVALVLDIDPAGVSVARMLASHGVDVYGAGFHEYIIGNFSKYIKSPSFGHKVNLDQKLLENLIQFSKEFGRKPVLIPCGDQFIEFVSIHFDVLKNYYLIQSSLSLNMSFKFLNKKDFYQLCEEYHVPYPKTIFLNGDESFEEIAELLRFPIILKPNLIHKWKKYLRGKKVILIDSLEALKDIFSNHKSIINDSMLQEVIPGEEDKLYLFKGYFNKDGKLEASFTGRKIRQYPPNFGSASLAESIHNDDVERISVKFLEALKFHGLCGSEFKYDERDCEYKMIEINIRPQLWEDLTRVAGKEIVWAAYCDLAGLSIPKQTPQKNGVKWIYLTRDIISALWHVKEKNLSIIDWIKSYKGTKVDAIIDFKDLRMLSRLPFYTFYEVYKHKVKPWLKSNS